MTVPAGPGARRGRPPGDPAVLDTRGRIAAAAFDLFADRGYDGTTVDAIAERAGIARRTFFRYFPSKDDVIFPDHDALLVAVQRILQASGSLPVVDALCAGVRQVFASYVNDPAVSVQRYRISRSVGALRDRELASVQRYERTFSRYVRRRLAGSCSEAEAALRADVLAAAVVAAHNAVLREWLRAGGSRDFGGELEAAFGWVRQTWADAAPLALTDPAAARPERDQPDRDHPDRDHPDRDHPDRDQPDEDEQAGDQTGVVVAVFRSHQPIDDVVERISRSL